MNTACRDLRDNLARGPDEPLAAPAEAHLATCITCRQHALAHERFLATLRAEPAEVDDVTRARWLARMSPQLDAIAEARGASWIARHRRGFAMVAAGVAVVAVVIGGALLRDRTDTPRQDAATPAVASLDREVLRPYVFAGAATSEHAATTYLAGRLSALDLDRGQLVRASFDQDRDLRITAVGPTHVEVESATTTAVELAVLGTLLVDTRAGSTIRIRTSNVIIAADHATFAVQTTTDSLAVFVDRGEVQVGATKLHAGEWSGPGELRTAMLVTMLRDHANALAPPLGRSGLLAVEGSDPVLTQVGRVVGIAPLWARVAVSQVALVIGGTHERRETVAISEASIARVRGPDRTPAIVATAPVSHAPTESGARSHAATSVLAPSPDVVERESPAQLYARAEAALRTGDRAAAEAIWIALVTEYPQAPLTATALYDLANLTRGRDRAVAQAYLTRLVAASPSAALRELAEHLACRLHVEAGELDLATTCFTAFRVSFPSSSHDPEILAWLIGRAQESGGCSAARGLATEYLRKYPDGAFAPRAMTCRDAP